MNRQTKANLALLGVSMLWGSSFVISKNTLDHLQTFNFLAIRFILSGMICSIIFYKKMLTLNRRTMLHGTIIGTVLFFAYGLWAYGLNFTTASKSGFIIGFSVVIVPLLSALILKKIPPRASIAGALVALIGLALLSLDGSAPLQKGDLFTLAAAFLFALHIITIGKFTLTADSFALAIVQISVVGLLSLPVTLIWETPVIPTAGTVWLNLALLIVLSTAVAYIVMNHMQKYTTPTQTALIFTTEPVFAAVFAFMLLGETLKPQGVVGSILILCGMIIAETNWNKILRRQQNSL
ncbi:DMT family transporter [Anoxynatronum buryatiense]|uniref:Permease of the drug/metabolite transporter (DMT) superfamily n=1 Tax=Anoxynatronum buryatiense TaxID=489973 RepID=A0AA45WX54_9CLOT|nr:DMT family transporter [Anoxynatronum buryatiense]SMP61287.1 Permease of the drug/metabolite transporter (DMT) superfamily [Anoxynatronum buryatiense]